MKRPLLIIALLLIGAIVNVAVAWGWAAWGVAPHIDSRTWSISHDDPPFWIMREFAGPGAAITLVKPELRSGQHVGMMQRVASIGPEVPDYVRGRFTDRPLPIQTWTHYAFDERGWPWRCLRSEHSFRRVNRPNKLMADVQVSGGIQLWPDQTQRGGWALQRVRALPLRPIWPGFIADTILYSIIAAIVLVGYPAMIRSLGARRSVRRAIIALAVAPLIVVGAAWLAAWQGARSLNQSGHRISGTNVERQDRPGATRVIFSGGSFQQFDWLPSPPIENTSPRWSARWHDNAAARESQPFEWTTVEATGWPARALASSYESRALPNLTIGATVQRGILLDPLPTGLDMSAPYNLRLLPTQPLWIGLAINWLLYAFVLFGLLGFPGAIKRGLRRRRGYCSECGYNLRGDFNAGCPECGWGRTLAIQA